MSFSVHQSRENSTILLEHYQILRRTTKERHKAALKETTHDYGNFFLKLFSQEYMILELVNNNYYT